jgi:hypothetical protein
MDYVTSRDGKKHVCACGLIEMAAIEHRKLGDFETAVWLDEQQHQIDCDNIHLFIRGLCKRMQNDSTNV